MAREVWGINGEVTGFVRFTGEFRFNPSDEPNAYWDFGSVDGHKIEVTPQMKPVTVSQRGGIRKVVREDVTQIDTFYTLHLQEEVKETLLAKFFATALSDSVQASGSGGTATITGVKKRRWYSLGKRKVTAVTVKVGAATKVEGTDYKLDRDLGMIYVMEDGSISDNDDLDITGLSYSALTTQAISPATKAKRVGSFVLVESDAQSAQPRRIHTGNCEITAQSTADRGQEDFEKYDLKVRVTGNHKIEDLPVV